MKFQGPTKLQARVRWIRSGQGAIQWQDSGLISRPPMAARSRDISPSRHRDQVRASCSCRRSSASIASCATSPTTMPRKAMSCWRRTCSGGWSPASSSAIREADFNKAFGYYQRFDANQAMQDVAAALDGAARAAGMHRQGRRARLLPRRQARLSHRRALGVDCAVCYYGVGIEPHLGRGGERSNARWCCISARRDKFAPAEARDADQGRLRRSPRCRDLSSIRAATMPSTAPSAPSFDKPAALMAHSRSIAAVPQGAGAALRSFRAVGQHTDLEFGARDAEATMATMVAEPYVNHIPTMTGGVGYAICCASTSTISSRRRRRTRS